MATTAAKPVAPAGNVPAMVLMLGASILLNYVDRGAIGIAAPLMKSALGLSATTFGIAVSAFFWTYAPLNFVAGWLSDRFCVYRLLLLGVAIWALSTALTGWVGSLAALVVLRCALGVGESIAFPGSSKVFAEHVPPVHRGLANSVLAFGIGFGPAVGTVAGGLILGAFGWRAVFWIFGATTVLWLFGWQIVSAPFRRMRAHRRPIEPVPLGAVLRSRALWAMTAAQFCANYALYFSLAWMPLYLVQGRGYSIAQMTALGALGLIAPLLAPVIGRWSDHIVARGADEDRVRRGFMVVSLGGSCLMLLGTLFSHTTAELVVWAILGSVCTSAAAVNLYAVAQTFGGARRAGAWVGVLNAVGGLAGIVGPIVTGVTIDRLGGFSAGFLLAAAIAALGAALWVWAIPPIREIGTTQV